MKHRPRYNVAPTQEVLSVLNDGGVRSAAMLRWGLIPHWAKDPSIGSRMINARAETVAEKPTFSRLLGRKRCLILADGFYEWKKDGAKRTPMRIVLKSQALFAFAGLWEVWQSPSSDIVRSCTIITTEPNYLMASIHNRMPVILPEEAEPLWLNPLIEDTKVLEDLLVPLPAESMAAYPVSTLVNAPKNDSPECVIPVE